MLCRNCNQYLEFYLATAKARLVAVPLNTWFKGKELSYLITNSGAKALIVDQRYLDVAKTLNVETVEHYIGFGDEHPYPNDLETLIREHSKEEPHVEIDEDDLFALGYTSGTTAKPKGCMLTHRNSIAGTIRQAVEWKVEPHSVYLLHAPMFFGAGGGGRLPPVLRGATCVIITSDTETVLRTIEREKITHFSMSPTPIKRLVDHPDVEKYDLSSVRVIGLTGAPHSVAEIKRIEEVFGHVWYSTWGMTESSNAGSTLQPEEVGIKGPTAKRMASVGKAQMGVEIRVVNENGEDISPNGKEVGEVIMRGDHVMVGYWNMPEDTPNTLRNGWLYSGDVAIIDEDGYIYIVDRKKDMIISGGINISPREIEEVIYTHPAVAHCAVIGVPDEKWGETPKAVVVLKEGMKATEDEIIELCRQDLASYKKPTSVGFVDSLPMTPTGKISKKDLLQRYWERYEKKVH